MYSVQGYSTLGTQWAMHGGDNPVLSHPAVLDIALKRNASAAHVALRWALQLKQVSSQTAHDMKAIRTAQRGTFLQACSEARKRVHMRHAEAMEIVFSIIGLACRLSYHGPEVQSTWQEI